ncbi:hypothetical protein PGT21_012063 [Puccinia graminis f. sp. tritici]|uniref:Uncharacterized protein n=1 Tax=Puccinia graminis f. sp. tritici TaxID=56615 RepID=A0A5B0P8X1_PUCGR|nr:hypothetical protein PGTUg99_008282 [Puccinia graminis f. sp. tritici]KAA1105574.1 hypothetical protein PGT21_012063 [Puccinia graminis f. sp. tritici]
MNGVVYSRQSDFDESNNCWNSIPKSSPHKRRALEISCSKDERATAKLKACDSDDVITLNDEDHQSSNSNLHQISSKHTPLINRISPPKTKASNESRLSH